MTDPNAQAFPHHTYTDSHMQGLTKRELAAYMAMQGALANPFLSEHLDKKSVQAKITTEQGISNFCVNMADALIAALNK